MELLAPFSAWLNDTTESRRSSAGTSPWCRATITDQGSDTVEILLKQVRFSSVISPLQARVEPTTNGLPGGQDEDGGPTRPGGRGVCARQWTPVSAKYHRLHDE